MFSYEFYFSYEHLHLIRDALAIRYCKDYKEKVAEKLLYYSDCAFCNNFIVKGTSLSSFNEEDNAKFKISLQEPLPDHKNLFIEGLNENLQST